jgi:hypothetical protein
LDAEAGEAPEAAEVPEAAEYAEVEHPLKGS